MRVDVPQSARAPHLRGDPNRNDVVRNIATDERAGADHGVGADTAARHDYRTHAYQHTRANRHARAEDAAGRRVRERVDRAVVIDRRVGVHDDAGAKPHSRRNHGTGANHGAVTDLDVGGHAGKGMPDGDEALPSRDEGARQMLATGVIADGDDDGFVRQRGHLLERTQDGQTHDGLSGEIGSIVGEPDRNQSEAIAAGDQDVSGNASMPAGADDEDADSCEIHLV